MDNTIQLRKNADGETVLVETTTVETETPLSGDELRRQIKEHAAILDALQRQLQAIDAFEAGELDEDTPHLDSVAQPIINQEVLDIVVPSKVGAQIEETPKNSK